MSRNFRTHNAIHKTYTDTGPNSAVRPAHISVLSPTHSPRSVIFVHNCSTQYCTEEFLRSSLLSSRHNHCSGTT